MDPQPKGFALIPGEKTLPIPQREKRRKSYGATWQSFHFISIDEPYLGFKNKRYILLFSYLENLYHAKGRGRYVRTPYGVHFAVFPFYMPLVNENLDFKITNIKTRFFTKTGHKFVFLCKNMLKILYETRMRTVKFHKTRWNCTQTVKFIQKISELTKMTIIIVCNSHQFLSTIKKCFSLCVWFYGLNKKPDYLYFFQKLERKVKRLVNFG